MSHKLGLESFEDEKTALQKPRLYKVVLLNDDFTTQEFVVDILARVFGKNAKEATLIMLQVHKNGRGVAGIYPYDIALSKAQTAMKLAAQQEFPLKAVCERA